MRLIWNKLISMMDKHAVSPPSCQGPGEGIRCINNETEMDGSLLICSAQIYVNVLNTMHSLWSVTQTGYCAGPGHEEKGGRGPLWSGSGPWRGYQLAMSAERCDLIIPIAYEPSAKQRNLLRACSRTNYPMIFCVALNTETFVGSDWMSCVALVWISLKGN